MLGSRPAAPEPAIVPPRHFAIVAPPFAGHLNPLQALAAVLVARGHRITFFGQADMAPLIDTQAFGFVPVGAASHPPGHLAAVIARIGRLHGVRGLGAVMADLVAHTTMLCRELPAALPAHAIDAIIADQTEAAGGLLARHLALPFVSIANALPINTEPAIPPPFTDWAYDPSPRGRRRNVIGARIAHAMMWRLNRVIARQARLWALGPLRGLEDCLSPRLQLSQLVAGLDFPREAAPAGFHYVGPLRGPLLAKGFVFPPAPFVFASLGTLQGNRAGLFRVMAESCRRAGLSCLIAHGGRLTAAEAASLPGTPVVVDFVPQREVLPHAAAVITHGGMNTVLDALTAGVPVVAVPLAFEQAAIAARLVHAGTGLAVAAGGVEGALRRILTEPKFRSCAAKLRQELAAAGGAERAADLIEGEGLRPSTPLRACP